jgi:hypothetical protein
MLCFAWSILSNIWYHLIGLRPETSYPLARSDLDHLVFHRYSSQSQNYDSSLLQPAGSNCTGQSTRMSLVLKDTWNQLDVKLGDSNMIRGGNENICPHFLREVYITTQCNSVRQPRLTILWILIYCTSSHVSQNDSIFIFFVNNFVQMTASSWLLWVGNMTLYMILDLLTRHRCFSTWGMEKPSSAGNQCGTLEIPYPG